METSIRRNKALIKELSVPAPGTKDLYFETKYSQPFTTQVMACLWKQSWSYWRNPPYTAVRFLFTLLIALMFGSMFWNLGSKTWVRLTPNPFFFLSIFLQTSPSLKLNLHAVAGQGHRICSTLWDRCLPQFYSWEFRTHKRSNRLLP